VDLIDVDGAGGFGIFVDGGDDVEKIFLLGVGFGVVLTGKFGEAGGPTEEILGVLGVAARHVGEGVLLVDGAEVAGENLAGSLDVGKSWSESLEVEKVEINVVVGQKQLKHPSKLSGDVGLLFEVEVSEEMNNGKENSKVFLTVVEREEVGRLFEGRALESSGVDETLPEDIGEPLGHLGLG